MANYTVSDILGVGFKYEQYAEEQQIPQATGTRAVVLGTSTWGPINTPTLITGGLREFKNTFGYAGTSADEGWEGAYSHFLNSSVGYFTRIASSTNPPTRSYKEVVNNATKAFIIGSNALGSTVMVYPSTAPSPNHQLDFVLRHKTGSMTTFEDLSFSTNLQTAGLTSEPAEVTATYTTSGAFSNGQTVSFKVYNESGTSTGTFTFTSSGSTSVTGAASYVTALLTSGSISAGQNTHFNLSSTGNVIKITTAGYYYGPNARIEVLNDALGLLTGKDDSGVSPSRSTLISYINGVVTSKVSPANNDNTLGVVYGSSLTFVTLNADNKAVFTAPSSGATSKITFGSGSFNTIVGVSNSATSTGVAAKTIGTFRAIRKGSEGNLIRIVVAGSATAEPSLSVYFRGSLIGSANLYNFISGDADNLSTLISDSAALSSVIKFDHAKTFNEFNDDDASLSTGTAISDITSSDIIGDGEYFLTSGTNGETITVLSDLIPEIVKYGNIDLYNIDFICAPGYPEQDVHNALLNDVCEIRQDCFALLDMPDFGTSSAAIDRAIAWTNGKYTGRSVKLDSYFGHISYPYVKIRKQLYNASGVVEGVLGDYSPTCRLPGTISRSDFTSKTKFAAVAGETRGGIANIEGLRHVLTQANRDRLYGDVYDNCINPIMFNLTGGFFINGQKSSLRKNSNGKLTALSRLNVVRIGLFIKKSIENINRFFFHEPNDKKSQEDFASLISQKMNELVEARAIQNDFIVICDASVNTDEIVNNNGLIAVIDFTPIKTIERIKVIANIKERNTTITVVS